jgi:hypothetical protein
MRLIVMTFVPATAYGQASITGTVRDTSGAVLPGVTVEASSPVLIEKVRTAVSDSTGQYRIESLPPGSYTTTFTLTGFRTVRRAGIELTGTFTATVNIEMQVGGVTEEVTVTSASPIVDLQSASQQIVLGKDTMAPLPTSSNYNSFLALVPGMTRSTSGDVQFTPCSCTFSGHGSVLSGRANGEGLLLLDGLTVSSPFGSSSNYVPDTREVAELSFTVAAGLGEHETGGPVINIVPLTGGNLFAGDLFGAGVPSALRGSNFTSALQQAGLPAPLSMTAQHDYSGGLGGPLVQDRLWFFTTARSFRKNQLVNMYNNNNAGNPNAWLYSPDTRRGQVVQDLTWEDAAVRLTTQITPRNKVSIFWDETRQNRNSQNGSLNITTTSPEATDTADQPVGVRQLTWTSPLTNKLLIEAGGGLLVAHFGGYKAHQDPYTGDLVRMVEQCSAGCPNNGNFPGLTYRSQSASTSNSADNAELNYSWRASVSYVTGAHSVKAGVTGSLMNYNALSNLAPNQLIFQVNNGVPNQLTMVIHDFDSNFWVRNDGYYIQDRWTRGRLTLSGALRYDRAWSWSPAEQEGPATYLPNPLVFPRTTGVDAYNDLTPRMSAVYDVFGDGKTALKLALGKYLAPATAGGVYGFNNPASRIASTVSRSWTDVSGTFDPPADGCDLLNPAAQTNAAGRIVCGAFSNANFGTSRFSSTIDPGILNGWGVRPSDWDLNVAVQRQVRPGMSVEVTYVQRWFQGFLVTDNLATPASAYSQFSVAAPLDTRLPGGGGNTVTGLYNVDPSFFGLTNNYVTNANNYGTQYAHSQSVDVAFTSRLSERLTIQGGVSGGYQESDSCQIRAALPETAPLNPFCHIVIGPLPEYKVLGSYMIPKADVQVGVTYMNKSGIQTAAGTGTPSGAGGLSANYVVSNAAIAPSLGRNLSGNAANATINLIPSGTFFGDRINELDLRASKIVKLGGTRRATVSVDLYNMLNVAPVLSYNQAYIPNGAWLTPLSVMTARFALLSARFEF